MLHSLNNRSETCSQRLDSKATQVEPALKSKLKQYLKRSFRLLGITAEKK